ncbi:MAG: hypothetical protein L0H93_03485 [Nocardioides sp.]|nr:hypothetical protein [Nocardioides sp.]
MLTDTIALAIALAIALPVALAADVEPALAAIDNARAAAWELAVADAPDHSP